MNVFQCCIYGLLSGLAEFLPISSDAHGILFERLCGVTEIDSFLRLFVHLGMLFSLLLACNPEISKLSRERKIAAIPARRRKRNPDGICLLDWRILKTAGIVSVLGFFAYPWVWDQGTRLWILGIGLVISGMILYIPQFIPGANKDAKTVSGLDAALIGLGGALGVLPGFSRTGGILSVSQIRGCDKNYGVHIALLLSVPALIIYCILDFVGMISSGFVGISFLSVLSGILSAVTAAFGSYLSIYLVKFLSVKAGFSTFAYYNWGLALFAFILYLAI